MLRKHKAIRANDGNFVSRADFRANLTSFVGVTSINEKINSNDAITLQFNSSCFTLRAELDRTLSR